MELTKRLILELLKNEKLMNPGECVEFTFKDWTLILRKEEHIYDPCNFSIMGDHKNGASWHRRYIGMEKALLHVLNHFNENANMKNRYKSLLDVMVDAKAEIKQE